MFIQCSDCDYKYIVNSADLKPDGRMVECANCNHRWFQEPLHGDELLSSSVPRTFQEKIFDNQGKQQNVEDFSSTNEIKNLPSTVVGEHKASVINSFLVVISLICLITSFFLLRSYGVNIFVLINFYLHEFYFNLKLIIGDIAKIIYQIIN